MIRRCARCGRAFSGQQAYDRAHLGWFCSDPREVGLLRHNGVWGWPNEARAAPGAHSREEPS